MSDVPFAVKEFTRYYSGYEPYATQSHPRYMATDMNEWFAELAADETRAYDIRQILQRDNGSILVFYEVSPVTEPVQCVAACPSCGNMVGHFCPACDNDE